MHLNEFQMFGFIITFVLFGEKNVIYTNTLLIYLINPIVHYCNHYMNMYVESYTESHSSRLAEVMEMGGIDN